MTTAAWAAYQIVEAVSDQTAPTDLLRDRDPIYGADFQRRVDRMGLRQVVIAPRAPWQDPVAEWVIGSIRRECLDHFLVFDERHLRRLLRADLAYSNAVRPQQALNVNSPHPRTIEPPSGGRIMVIPHIRGRQQRADQTLNGSTTP